MLFGGNIPSYIIIYLFLPMAFLYGLKIMRNNDMFLDKKNTDNLRGAAIIVIAIHHLVLRANNPGLLAPFTGVGYLGVSIFFFLSGYGLASSYIGKANYLDRFFGKRITKIFIPFIIVNLVQLIVMYIFYGVKYNFMDFVFYTFGIKIINGPMWYIMTILFWYICFFVFFKYFSKNNAVKLMFALGILYFLFCYKNNLVKYWYDTSFIFPIGVLFAFKRNYISNIIKRYYKYLLPVLSVLFVILFISNHDKSTIAAVSVRALSSITFILIISLFLYKFSISENKILSFLGKISFEIYLIHDRVLSLKIPGINNSINAVSILYYFALTIILSVVLNKFNLFMVSAIDKIINRKDRLVSQES